MDLSNPPATRIRHDGWTPERRTRFLDRLARDGNVLAACAHVGMSRETAYQLRRRDPLFARAWAAAQALGREASAQELATRALDGVEEDVWYRGEVVGTRRRYDNRLLLAHVARLDKLAEANPQAEADMGRFDELLARVAGVELPEGLLADDPDLPLPRRAHAEEARRVSEDIWQLVIADGEHLRECAGAEGLDAETTAEWVALEKETRAAWINARPVALAGWDAWFAEACDTVDRLLAQPAGAEADPAPRTLSGLSASPPSDA